VAVSGAKFGASSVPTLKQFIRDVTRAVPSPKGGMVYDEWRKSSQAGPDVERRPTQDIGGTERAPAAQGSSDVPVGDLGSGSDYTVFLQHLGVPSSDVSSAGSYGVYHSVFDNFNWFKKFGDPDFAYEQEMARVFGLEAIRMSDADVLPYDYEQYGKEIASYVETARRRSEAVFGGRPSFADAVHALLIPEGLPNRPWFRHVIYAPGQYTGYAAVVIPGVNEAIDKRDQERTRQQIAVLAAALNRAAKVLEDYR
jgi:N-acetylated-alpha-linked acidic dipeptidase